MIEIQSHTSYSIHGKNYKTYIIIKHDIIVKNCKILRAGISGIIILTSRKGNNIFVFSTAAILENREKNDLLPTLGLFSLVCWFRTVPMC